MGKKVQRKAGIIIDTALVTFGWLSFIGSFLINSPIIVIILQSIARVLPKAFY